MLMSTGLLKTGWEALTVFLVSLFSLTRRYDNISIIFPDAPSKGGRMAWVLSQRWGEKHGSRQACPRRLTTFPTLYKPKDPCKGARAALGGHLWGHPDFFSPPRRQARWVEAGTSLRGSPGQRSIPHLPSAGSGLGAGPF